MNSDRGLKADRRSTAETVRRSGVSCLLKGMRDDFDVHGTMWSAATQNQGLTTWGEVRARREHASCGLELSVMQAPLRYGHV